MHHLPEASAEKGRILHGHQVQPLHQMSPFCQAGGLVPSRRRCTQLHWLDDVLGQGEEEENHQGHGLLLWLDL